jgi:hypothetical protein
VRIDPLYDCRDLPYLFHGSTSDHGQNPLCRPYRRKTRPLKSRTARP